MDRLRDAGILIVLLLLAGSVRISPVAQGVATNSEPRTAPATTALAAAGKPDSAAAGLRQPLLHRVARESAVVPSTAERPGRPVLVLEIESTTVTGEREERPSDSCPESARWSC